MASGESPTVELRPITAQNWHECANLALGPGQEAFVAPNLYSIAEAQFYPPIVTRAICHEGAMVGFVAYGFKNVADPDDPILGWSWQVFRFMIAHEHQGRGLGLAAMRATIAAIVAAPEHRPGDPLLLTYRPENVAAANLYARLGFTVVGTGVRDRIIARLELPA